MRVDGKRKAVGSREMNHLARDGNPSRTGETVIGGVDGVAAFLRRKVGDVEIDPRLVRLAGVVVIADQEFAGAEDVEGLLIELVVGSGPAIDLRGEGSERCARRETFVARMRLENERGRQHKDGGNPETQRAFVRPVRAVHADAPLGSGMLAATAPLSIKMRDSPRCTANSKMSATTKMSHPEKVWKNPSALSGSQYWTSRPVPKMRKLLATTAMGTAETASSPRIPMRVSIR